METIRDMLWLEQLEPRFSALFYKVIEFCLSPKTFEELDIEIMSSPEMATPVQSTAAILEWLEECGGLAVTPAQEEAPKTWQATNAGIAHLKRRADKLNKVKSENEKIISEILMFCRNSRRLTELEQAFPSRDNEPRVGYYILELERAGAVEWRNGWTTTEQGWRFVKAIV